MVNLKFPFIKPFIEIEIICSFRENSRIFYSKTTSSDHYLNFHSDSQILYEITAENLNYWSKIYCSYTELVNA